VEKKVLDEILGPKVYDPRIRPAGENGTGREDKKSANLSTILAGG
jgi:hypothetical protein